MIVCLNVSDEDSAAGDEATGGGASEEAGPGSGPSGNNICISL